MDKKLENALDDLFGLVTCQDSFEEGQKCYDILEEALTTKSKKEQAFDIIKENFDIEAIVIDDYCYIEITSKICALAKTQRAIKINSENESKVEALKEVLKNEI